MNIFSTNFMKFCVSAIYLTGLELGIFGAGAQSIKRAHYTFFNKLPPSNTICGFINGGTMPWKVY